MLAKNPGKKQPGLRPWTRGPAAVRFRWIAKPVSAQGSVRPVPVGSRAAWFKVASPEIIQVSPGHLDPAAHDLPKLESSCSSTGA